MVGGGSSRSVLAGRRPEPSRSASAHLRVVGAKVERSQRPGAESGAGPEPRAPQVDDCATDYGSEEEYIPSDEE